VILPVYNGGDYLRESVASVLAQTVEDFEFLILDDASTDWSWDYLSSLADKRVRLFRNATNRGLFFNLNYLINQSRGELIKLWSQDDRMYPHCLQAFLDFHGLHPALGFSYSGRDIIDGNGEIRHREGKDETPTLVSTALHARIAFYTGSIAGNIANVCIRRQALEKTGLFNESMQISGDFDMWVRLAQHFDTGFIPDRLIQLRDHSGQLSRREELYIRHVKEDLQVYRYLQGYVSPALRQEGRRMLRQYKLVFYYTLMVKSLLKGRPKAAFLFYKELAAFDNFWILSLSFLKARIRKPAPPVF
jgi:glycosyltransferase involved in cell wall biosynthesis